MAKGKQLHIKKHKGLKGDKKGFKRRPDPAGILNDPTLNPAYGERIGYAEWEASGFPQLVQLPRTAADPRATEPKAARLVNPAANAPGRYAAVPPGVIFTDADRAYVPSDESMTFVQPKGGRVETEAIGDTGLLRAGGFVEHDFQKEWTNPRKYKTINMMLRAPMVAGAVYAVDNIIRRVNFRITTPDGNNSTSAKAAAAFVEQALDDMEITWAEVIAQVCTYQWFGFSLMEILCKMRNGRSADPTQDSKYDDGMIGWRRFSMRAQETLWRWEFDEWGNATGVFQISPNHPQEVYVPIRKCWHMQTTNRKQSPEGVSLLLGCWDAWYKMTFMQKYEAIGMQRDLAGFPVAYIPGSIMNGQDDASKAAYAAWQKLVTNIQVDEQGSIILPSDVYDLTKAPQYRFELLRSPGNKQFDTSAIIGRYALQILIRFQADFLMSANAASKGGSHAAHSDKSRIFEQALQSEADQIADEFTRQCIRELVRLNGWDEEDTPVMVADDIEVADMGEVGTYLTALNTAGVPLTAEVFKTLYKIGNLPLEGLDAALVAKQAATDAANKLAQTQADTALEAAKQTTAPPADDPKPSEIDTTDAPATADASATSKAQPVAQAKNQEPSK